jgi:hypothetical protein
MKSLKCSSEARVIVNTASVNGFYGSFQDFCIYCVQVWGDWDDKDCGPGVRLRRYTGGCIMPRAGVDLEEFWKTAAASIPGRRMGRPEDMAEAAMWLCSDAAYHVTGHAMVVDGAMTAGSLLEWEINK